MSARCFLKRYGHHRPAFIWSMIQRALALSRQLCCAVLALGSNVAECLHGLMSLRKIRGDASTKMKKNLATGVGFVRKTVSGQVRLGVQVAPAFRTVQPELPVPKIRCRMWRRRRLRQQKAAANARASPQRAPGRRLSKRRQCSRPGRCGVTASRRFGRSKQTDPERFCVSKLHAPSAAAGERATAPHSPSPPHPLPQP
jgi:hypothetical protein